MFAKVTPAVGAIALSAIINSTGAFTPQALAGGCTPSTGPDVIVGQINGWTKWGTLNVNGTDYSAYSFGAVSCNIGNEGLPWYAQTNQHPVIASQVYRFKGGRFEQLGMSWVKHGWGALTDSLCCPCIDPGDFEILGVGCSDPYDSGLNGDQNGLTIGGGVTVSGLGPRSQVNASNGVFAWPYATIGQSGNALYKRLHMAVTDLDPAQNGGAAYYGECYYVTPHDMQSGNGLNSVSYRRFLVGGFNTGSYDLSWTGTTVQQLPAIYAWRGHDTAVTIVNGDVPGEGRFVLGYKASNNGDGTWHYEYALYNHNSDRCGGGFHLPVPSTITVSNIGFHDVDHHSGDGAVIGTNYDGTDWANSHSGGSVNWSVVPTTPENNANALRWGTLYNFRFDANAPPAHAQATLDLFATGSPASIMINTVGPRRVGDVNGDGLVNIIDLLAVIAAWGTCPPPSPGSCDADINGDGQVNITDLLATIAHWG